MKKIVLSLAMMLSLSACPAPSGTTNPSTSPSTGATASPVTGGTLSGRLATKAQFIAFLNCLKTQANIDVEAKSAIDLQIQAVNLIPDIAWVQASAGFGEFLNTYAKYNTTCQ